MICLTRKCNLKGNSLLIAQDPFLLENDWQIVAEYFF